MLLKPSTSLTLHYSVPPSLCRWTLTRCFAALLQALLLVTTRICHWWTPESLAILPWDGSLAIHSVSHHGKILSPSAVSPWEDSLSLRSLAIAMGWVPTGRLSVDKLLCYPLVACGIAVLSLRLHKETPPHWGDCLWVDTGMFYLFLTCETSL